MDNLNFGRFNELNKSALESAKELESINTKLFEKLTQKNMDVMNTAVEMNNKFVSLFGEATGVQELIDAQMKLSSEYNGKMITAMKEAADILTASKDDYQAWFEAGVKTASESVQDIVPTAAKTTRKKAA